MLHAALKLLGLRDEKKTRPSARQHSPTERPTAPRTEEEWKRLRQPASERDKELTKVAQAWLESLPPRVRPQQLCARYARIANRLSLCWNDPELAERVFDDLMIDHRGTRQGFPPAVAAELITLRGYHHARHGSRKTGGVWDSDAQTPTDRGR